MRSIDDYCEIAQARNGLKSDRELAKRLSVSPAVPSQWRTRRTWPADNVMMRLAALAGIDEAEALMDLAIWRTSDEARPVYERLLKMVTKTTLGAAFAFSVNANAATISYAVNTDSAPSAEVTDLAPDCIL